MSTTSTFDQGINEYVINATASDKNGMNVSLEFNVKGNTVDEAMKKVTEVSPWTLDDNITDVRYSLGGLEEFTVKDIRNGYIPESFNHVSDRNPSSNGIYHTIILQGSMTTKAIYSKNMFRNGRWTSGDWTNIVAWSA